MQHIRSRSRGMATFNQRQTVKNTPHNIRLDRSIPGNACCAFPGMELFSHIQKRSNFRQTLSRFWTRTCRWNNRNDYANEMLVCFHSALRRPLADARCWSMTRGAQCIPTRTFIILVNKHESRDEPSQCHVIQELKCEYIWKINEHWRRYWEKKCTN
jgi:hypothetical protein